MASYNLDLDPKTYAASIATIRTGVTEKGANLQKTKKTSAAVHDVTIKKGQAQAKVYLRESDLYFIGWQGAQNKNFFFKGDVHGNGTALTIGCNYNGASNLAIYGGSAKTLGVSKLADALTWLSGYTAGGQIGDTQKVYLASIAFVLSEALRFKNVTKQVEALLKSNGDIKWADYEGYLTNWSTISTGTESDAIRINGTKSSTARQLQSDLAVWLL